MPELKIPLVMLRCNFVGEPTESRKAAGYYRNVCYDLWIKQEGESFWVKRADERVKGESKTFYKNLWEFTEDWSILFKYIRDK